MKKILLISSFTLFLLSFANATHNAGGEITVKQIDYLKYEATIHTYTIASSIPADRDSLLICWGDGDCNWVIRDTSYLIGNGYKYNRYPSQHSYSQEGDFTISMTDPNRNSGILNLNYPVSDNVAFHIETKILVSTIVNNTPLLLNPITDLAYIGEEYQHNAAAVDCDGDSLIYELIVPLDNINSAVSIYSFPNEVSPGPNNNLTLDSEFGTLIWNAPPVPGLFTVAIKISEYRENVLLSTTIRDFQITVKDALNSPPLVQLSIGNEVTLDVGDILSIDVTGTDPDDGELWLQAFGQPFLLDNPASFNAPSVFQVAPLNADFTWEITNDHALLSPHYLVFRLEEKDLPDVEEGGLTNYQVVKINIIGLPTSTKTPEKNIFDVYPNPIIDGNLTLAFDEAALNENIHLKIVSQDGKILLEKNWENNQLYKLVNLNHLNSGSYIIWVTIGERMESRIIWKK